MSFADRVVSVTFDDASLAVPISRILRHCSVDISDTSRPAQESTFQVVTADSSTRRLLSGDEVITETVNVADLIERLIYAVTVALGTSSHSSLVFHAAGLASSDRGLLLCGESGCGKSTLTTTLVDVGLDFLSDELVAISTDGAQMEGFPRAIALKDVSPFVNRICPRVLRLRTATTTIGGVIYLDPDALRSSSLRRRATPAALVFPRYSAVDSPKIRSLSPAETAFLLLPRLVNSQNLLGHGFRAVTSLARRVPGFRLVYRDLAQASGWLTQIIIP